jgi:hypothetical protein
MDRWAGTVFVIPAGMVRATHTADLSRVAFGASAVSWWTSPRNAAAWN